MAGHDFIIHPRSIHPQSQASPAKQVSAKPLPDKLERQVRLFGMTFLAECKTRGRRFQREPPGGTRL